MSVHVDTNSIASMSMSTSTSESSSAASSRSSNSESSASNHSCFCKSCQIIRSEKRALRKMNFDHASVLSEFYPGKMGGGVFDRTTIDSRHSSNIYDTVDPVARYPYENFYMFGHAGPNFHNCFPVWSLATPEASPSSVTRILERSVSPTMKRSRVCCTSQEYFVAAIGVFGIILGSAGLLAYLIMQTPEFRQTIGPNYATREGRSHESIYNPSTLIYSVEVVAVVLTTLIGILVNGLLVHGVRKRSCYFLLPWLAYHVLFIAGLLIAIILVICFAMPFIYRLFALIPALAALLFIFLWAKVYLVFLLFRNERRLGPESNLDPDDSSWYAPAEQPSPTQNWI